MKLSKIIQVEGRYSRSVNLERDVGNAASLSGYVLSDRNYGNATRFFSCVSQPDHPRAWTITGLYGTGKSAFANFVLGLFGSSDTSHHVCALEILKSQADFDSRLLRSFRLRIGRKGLIRAVATATREPLSHTIVRALRRGASEFWGGVPGVKPAVVRSLVEADDNISGGGQVPAAEALRIVKALAALSKSGLIILVDELGKNFEYAATAQDKEDIYLLQQLAELPSGKNDPIVCIVGVLHQAFSEYTQRLTGLQQREWAKIQGRFEDIPFHETPLQVTKVIAKALSCDAPESIETQIDKFSKDWMKHLNSTGVSTSLGAADIHSLYPLHPLSALILPLLSERFAQNDRSVFTFLSSQEPHSLGRFLDAQDADDDGLPTLKLYHLYDYFIESLGLGMANHRLFQRWAEIQSVVNDAERLGVEYQQLLKSVGIFNLVSTSGEFRATTATVLMAMVDNPKDLHSSHWRKLLKGATSKSLVVHRKQVDELRIWQGSDFDISAAINGARDTISLSSAGTLTKYFNQMPLIASRHSYETGTLRYFERCFLNREAVKTGAFDANSVADGVLCYWIDRCEPDGSETAGDCVDRKPVLMVRTDNIESVIDATEEFAAIQYVLERSPEIRTDGVARKELGHRLRIARDIVDRALQLAFHRDSCRVTWFDVEDGYREFELSSMSNLCSDVLDQVYHAGLVLSNELINRKVLTSQAAKARR